MSGIGDILRCLLSKLGVVASDQIPWIPIAISKNHPSCSRSLAPVIVFVLVALGVASIDFMIGLVGFIVSFSLCDYMPLLEAWSIEWLPILE